MKKLLLFSFMLFFSIAFVIPQASAASTAPSVEMGVVPANKGISKKEQRKRLKKARKKYRQEMRGMTKAEKQAFLLDKISQPDQTQVVPHKKLLIIALIFLVVGWILGAFFGYWIGAVGSILLLVWLILFLMDYL